MRIRLTPHTRARALEQLRSAPDGYYYLPPQEPTRNLATNAKMWAMLADIARQKQWPVNGVLQWLKPDAWKDIFTAALAKEQRMAKGLYGGDVLLGEHTSGMSQRKMGELIELMYAWGAENGVTWSEPVDVPEWARAA